MATLLTMHGEASEESTVSVVVQNWVPEFPER